MKKIKMLGLVAAVSLALVGCGSNESDMQALKDEVSLLKEENAEIKELLLEQTEINESLFELTELLGDVDIAILEEVARVDGNLSKLLSIIG